MAEISIKHIAAKDVELEKLSDLEVYSMAIEYLLVCGEHEVQGVFDDGELGSKNFIVKRVDARAPGVLIAYDEDDKPMFTVHILEVK